jgi:hypothetical protein
MFADGRGRLTTAHLNHDQIINNKNKMTILITIQFSPIRVYLRANLTAHRPIAESAGVSREEQQQKLQTQ